jgi:iron complex transport system substrate-binding protein
MPFDVEQNKEDDMSKIVRRISGGLVIVLLVMGGLLLLRQDSPVTQREKPAILTVRDSAGRNIEIPKNPQRVIVLNPSNLDLYYAAGGKVVGKPTTQALPPAVKEAVKDIPALGTTANPDIEKMLTLKPDLILGVNAPPHHNLIPVLEKAGVPILLQALESYQQILDTLDLYGQLTGNPGQAEKEIARIKAQYEEVIQGIAGKRPPKVLVIWGSTESFNMATPKSFTGDLVERLGGINIAQGQDSLREKMSYVPLSMEYVAKENPEVILLITHSTEEKVVEKLREDLAKHPAWQGLNAVRNNRVSQLPYQLFAVNPGTRVGEALHILEKLLYPEVGS